MARKTVILLPSTERVLQKVGANIKRAKVIVHEAEGGRTKDRTQQVDIYFNFIGNIVLPLSEEEMKAMQAEEAIKEKELAEKKKQASKRSAQRRNQKRAEIKARDVKRIILRRMYR